MSDDEIDAIADKLMRVICDAIMFGAESVTVRDPFSYGHQREQGVALQGRMKACFKEALTEIRDNSIRLSMGFSNE